MTSLRGTRSGIPSTWDDALDGDVIQERLR